MRIFAQSFVRLAAVIMILVTLAISTAAVSQWAGAGDESPATTTAALAPSAG